MQLQNFNQEGMRTRPVSCDFTYLVDATISLYNSWLTMFRQNHKLRAQKRYRTVGIGSSAAYCGGQYVELVMAALNRGGSVRPPCACRHESAPDEIGQKQRQTTTCCKTEPAPVESYYMMSVIDTSGYVTQTHQLKVMSDLT